MSEISKAYEPGAVEERWYAEWTQRGCFTADPASPKPPFSIVIPPPNVTGVLTLGHVLNNTLQDILARRARQQGKEVLWLPGTDHAGIATQTVVERQLRKEEGKTRRDLGREEFLKRVWTWKEKHGGIIIKQLKRLGCSCDWGRERFTMDDDYSRQVQEVFVKLHVKGLIYRGKRMVNWCPASQTALSDEEVIMKPAKGKLYVMRYQVAEEPGTFLEIATTRPETLMGDTAVAVHPDDPRYARFVGKHAVRPFPHAEIPIIGDAHIDMTFGTGVLKVTPAHDKADFEIGQRHGLEVIDVMNPDGTLNALAGPEFAGMERFSAREAAAKKLEEMGLLVRVEDYENNVGYSERADVPIEPRLSEQWFLKYPQVPAALEAVTTGKIRFVPERWAKIYEHWMTNIQDWCISRQLWWGHRIPVWYRKDDASVMHVGLDAPADADNWRQDEDVLDTWFSSWLWPFATMDEATRKKFYPTNDLVTGPDIIFFWVARMIMAGLEFTGQVPFRNVFFTSIIRDLKGRKMSKSLGNSPDPLDLMAKYGADGLRFGLMRIAPHGQDVRFDENQIKEGRNFANKLWNAARFREMQGASGKVKPLAEHKLSPYSVAVLVEFDAMHASYRRALDDFHFHEAATVLYDFFWSTYCDWYVEASKAELAAGGESADAVRAVMDHVLSGYLRLLHPFMPHITEELWERLGFAQGEGSARMVLFAAPPPEDSLPAMDATEKARAANAVQAVYDAVREVRGLRAEFKVPSNAECVVHLARNSDFADFGLSVFRALAKASSVVEVGAAGPSKKMPHVLTPLGEVYLELEIDVDAERARLQAEIAKVDVEIAKVEAKLGDASFVQGAPPQVIENFKKRGEDWRAKRAKLEAAIGGL
ncbi:MAG: valine--tRNA ligase [Chthoniobacterales bacterium]|nr:valine--tRNA ligase [Chthoniobacterales bacterium]